MVKKSIKSIKNLKGEVKEMKKRSFSETEKTQHQNAYLLQFPQVSYLYPTPGYNGVFFGFFSS
jgi:hypothetical protein